MTTAGQQAEQDAVRSVARQLRQYALGELAEADHGDLSKAAALFTDDDQRRHMIFAQQAWERQRDDDEPPFWETDYAVRRVEQAASEVATRAVEQGNVGQIQYLLGWPEYESDVSGLHSLQRMESWLLDSEQCKIAYLADHMGSGKTEFVHLCADVIEFRSERRDDLADAEFAANIPSSDMETITDWRTFREWVEQGEVGENRWFFFDEASQALTGYSDDRQAVERLMSRLVKLARKFGVNIVYIGHTGMDLHADLRRLADYVTKPSQKTARVYASVNKGEGEGHLFDLDGLPTAKHWGFETDDTAEWSWGDALDSADGYDESEIKRLVAKRAARLVEDYDLSEEKAVSAVSDDEISISRYMVRQASEGAYGPISA